MSRSADWLLRLDGEAWTLQTPAGTQRHEVADDPAAALAQLEGRAGDSRRGLAVVVGDAWLRYLVLSWPPGMRRRDERLAFMAHRFRRVHDIEAPAWVLSMDSGVVDYPALACAIPAPLLDALRDFAEVRNLGVLGVTGDFTAAFNASQPRFDDPPGTLGAFALLRGRRLSVGLWRDGAWLALRSQNVAGQGSDLLPALLAAWRREFAAGDGRCVLYTAGPVAATPADWPRVAVEAP